MTTVNTEDEGTQWVPFGMDDDEAAIHTALRPDIPEWLEQSLWDWIKTEFTAVTGRSSGYNVSSFKLSLVRQCERVLRVKIPLDAPTNDINYGLSRLKLAYHGEPDIQVWRLVDFCLAESYRSNKEQLQLILTQSGSAWAVGTRLGKPGLVKRLPDGVVDAAHTTFTYGDAGQRLAQAWESAFGVNPDPEAAYSRAVKAVEDAAIPVVSPKNDQATLGTVIRDIRSGGKFSLPNLREHTDAKTHEVLLSMLQMLWTGQHDRHGGPSSIPVPNVTQEEAEAAVMLAIPLVGWFETGKVQK